MDETTRILVAGESWVTHSIHQKGVDAFTTTSYAEGVGWFRAALEDGGFLVDFLPNHLAMREFPISTEGLAQYGLVVLSDIGANTLLLHPRVTERSMPTPNRLSLLREYVADGGALLMIGGYMTFQGIHGMARYKDTPVEEVLPVQILEGDDRVEVPEGRHGRLVNSDHPVSAGLPEEWPTLLGYNRVLLKPEATLVAEVGGDVLLAVWDFEEGRTAAFTSDCGPHWCPPNFLEWPGYGQLWRQLVSWMVEQH
jgi:uncharacterized membrane protein